MFRINLTDLKAEHIHSHPWLIRTIKQKSILHTLLSELKQLALSDCNLLKTSLARIHKCPHISFFAEQYFIKVLNDCLSIFLNLDPETNEFKRQHLATTLSLSMLGISEGSFLIEDYQRVLKEQSKPKSKWYNEYNFWKLQYSFIRTGMPDECGDKEAALLRVKQIISFIEFHTEISDKIDNTTPQFIWHASTMEFAKHFHSFVCNHNMSLKGQFDIEPYVTKLHQLILVKKDRGEGYLSCASLLTYFKQINADTLNQ